MPPKPIPAAERFWRYVQKTETCWLWTAGVSPVGYGRLSVGGRAGGPELAHRFSWRMANGPIPAGMYVLHHCDNPPCVRPDHLFLGTQLDNIADMMAKGRDNRCEPRAGSTNGFARLTEDRVRDARRRVAAGETTTAIAREYCVERSTVGLAVLGKTWRHIVDVPPIGPRPGGRRRGSASRYTPAGTPTA